jgi:hypothetical protein
MSIDLQRPPTVLFHPAMAGEEELWSADTSPSTGSPQRSRAAQALAGCANVSYWLALVLAAIFLLLAGAFAAFSPEPGGPRLMSLVFLGIVPAITACSVGFLVYCSLKGASAIYDRVAGALLSLTLRTIIDAALIGRGFLVGLTTKPFPRRGTKAIAFLETCRYAVSPATRVISFYFVVALASYRRALIAVVRRLTYSALVACLRAAATTRACGRALAWSICLLIRAALRMLRIAADATTNLPRAIEPCVQLAAALGRTRGRLFAVARRYARIAGRTSIMGLTFPVRLVARILIRLFPSATQVTASETVAVIKIARPERPQNYDSNSPGVDRTGLRVHVAPAARSRGICSRDRQGSVVSVVPCGRGRRVALVASALLAASGLGWLAGSTLHRLLDPKGPESTTQAVIDSVIERIIAAESNGDPNAKNKRSSATGAGQFIDETWLDMIRAHRPDLAWRSEKEKLDLRRDLEFARQITARFAEQNAAMLSARGFTPSTLYLSHFAGRAGAVAILSAPDNADAASVMASADATGRTTREKIVKANPFLHSFTVADLKSWADRKMRAVRSAAAATRAAATGKPGSR